MINTLETKKVVTALVVVAMIFGAVFALSSVKAYALTEAQIQSILSLLSSFGADQATVNNVDSSLRGLPTSGTGTTGATACTFTRSLTIGSQGADVTCLQDYLTGTGHFTFSGGSTGFFGSVTQSAVSAWQAANSVAPAVGYFGPLSQAKYTAVAGSTGTTGGTTGGTTTPAPTGTGMTVTAGSQPAASLAPDSAARVPFTRINVTAGTDGDVVLNSVSVKRVGLAANAVFSGIVLIDENGVQLGTSKTLGSNDQAVVGEAVTIKSGQTRTFTVAGNMAADNATRDGQVVGLQVIGVNTSATVSGSLPISGTQHTVNASLAIGSATLAVSSFDPNSAQTKEIGTTGVRIAGIRVTAGSAEDIRIRNIRWNQTGSAGSTDITNIKTVVDGTEYTTTVSSDGKFYTANFGSGIVVTEGNNADIYVKGDIVGGSNRTIVMDIDKDTDIYITGETFGYGITGTAGSTASAATTSSQFTTGTPFFDASHMTISAGSATTIQKSASVPAQNIAVNVPNQPLGAFETDIKGEAINVSGMTLTVASTTGSGTGLLTNVTIVDQNGAVIAGPIDATYTSATVQTLTYTDSITIPTGKMVYTVKGKVASNIGNGGTYIVTVTPSGWTSPRGDITGDTITLSQGAFTLNTMTIKAAALDISISSTPVAQNITAGAQGFTFANVQLDATQSGEDVRFASIPLAMTFATMEVTQVTACQLFDGGTALNTGSNVVDPSGASDADQTFTLDTSLTIPKGTIKTLALKCNLASSVSANDSLSWGINAAPSITVTGVTSSNSVTETVTASAGQTMTVAAVSVVASKDSSSPSYTIAAAGTTGVTAGVYKFRAANEAVTLQRVGLTLTNSASSSASDLVQVSLYDGATKVGTAVFTGASTRATSTLSTPVTLPKDTDKTLTVKVDLANIGTSQSGTQGHLIAVDIDTNSTNTQGVGQESGTTVNASGTTAVDGIRMFKSYPTFAKLAVPSTTLVTSTMDLYRFSVTAASKGSIGIYKFTVNIATSATPANTSSSTVTNLKVLGYTDSGFSQTVSGFTTAGQLNDTITTLISSGNTDVLMTGSTQGQDYLQVPAGVTYYFRVVADVTLEGGPTGGSVTTNLQGDANYPINGGSYFMSNAASTTAFTNANGNDFIWSPNATTTSDVTHLDWTNGHFVPGLPSDNMDSQVIVK